MIFRLIARVRGSRIVSRLIWGGAFAESDGGAGELLAGCAEGWTDCYLSGMEQGVGLEGGGGGSLGEFVFARYLWLRELL